MFCSFTKANTMNAVCIQYIRMYQNTWHIWVQLYFGGSYDCKLNTIEGSHCSTTEN